MALRSVQSCWINQDKIFYANFSVKVVWQNPAKLILIKKLCNLNRLMICHATHSWQNISFFFDLRYDGIFNFRYPRDANIKEKWINATRRDNWMPSKHSVICSRHLSEDCFIYMKNRRRLLKSAIPTLFLPLLVCCIFLNCPRTQLEHILPR